MLGAKQVKNCFAAGPDPVHKEDNTMLVLNLLCSRHQNVLIPKEHVWISKEHVLIAKEHVLISEEHPSPSAKH